MAKETYMATIQVVIHPDEGIEDEASACDWFSGLLTEDLQANNKILDWAYLKVGAQYTHPAKILVNNPEEYEEGDFLNR